MDWGRPQGLLNVVGGDPGTGAAVAIPSGARKFFVMTRGTGEVLVRTAPNATVAGLAAANAFVGPVTELLGPFSLSPQADTHVHIGEHTAAVISAYFVMFTRG